MTVDHAVGALRQVQDNLMQGLTSLQAWLSTHAVDANTADDAVDQVLDRVGAGAVSRYLRSTATGDELTVLADAFGIRLRDVAATSMDWSEAVDQFESANAVVLLNAHRSKGLEYHTVFFVSLDDEQWWAHLNDRKGSTSAFFVGLSRAAQRLVFTTAARDARTGKIEDLYRMLDEAGVPEIDRR